MTLQELFPNLANAGFQVTSPATPSYHCIAWAVGDTELRRDFAPGYYWPRRIPRNGFLDEKEGKKTRRIFYSSGRSEQWRLLTCLELPELRWTATQAREKVECPLLPRVPQKEPPTEAELTAIRRSVVRGQRYGSDLAGNG